MDRKRFWLQALSALLHNANWRGFFTGTIYQGPAKAVCVPGLNCHACPGAVGACPVGALQSFLGGMRFRFPYYVLGLLIFFGALLGRGVCGLLCPFGLFQELIYKIPFVKKNRFPGDRPLRLVKYGVLGVLVVGLPLAVELTPFFCKYLCPSGTLAGVLLALRAPLIRGQLGALFTWKFALLMAVVLACLAVWRPFCKYLCPLGAIYGFFNPFSLYRMEHREERCVHCGGCAAACGMCVDPRETPNSAECVRCGLCVRACPASALRLGFGTEEGRASERKEKSRTKEKSCKKG